MISHYVEIKATVFDEDVHFVVNKVYNRLHGCIASLNLNIGLSFPKMTEVSPGDLIRCFGVESDLNSLKDNAGIEHLRSKGMVILSEIKIVPDTATPVAYVRDRQVEKVTSHRIRRKINRCNKRMLIQSQQRLDDETVQQIKVQLRQKQSSQKRAYFLVERQGDKFPIYIKKQFVLGSEEGRTRIFNSYGLGNSRTTAGAISTVYDF